MKNTFGSSVTLTLFGESHGAEIGAVLDGLCPGMPVDEALITALFELEFFDISNPSHIVRDSIIIGKESAQNSGYFVTDKCIGCKLCYSVCPQKCINIDTIPVVVNPHHCLHCGRCAEICPKQAITI